MSLVHLSHLRTQKEYMGNGKKGNWSNIHEMGESRMAIGAEGGRSQNEGTCLFSKLVSSAPLWKQASPGRAILAGPGPRYSAGARAAHTHFTCSPQLQTDGAQNGISSASWAFHKIKTADVAFTGDMGSRGRVPPIPQCQERPASSQLLGAWTRDLGWGTPFPSSMWGRQPRAATTAKQRVPMTGGGPPVPSRRTP